VNDKLQTSNRSIFAVGDVCTEYHFTHVAGDSPSRFRDRDNLGLQIRERKLITISLLGHKNVIHIGVLSQLPVLLITRAQLAVLTSAACAYFMARTVIKNALFFGSGRMSSLLIPWVITQNLPLRGNKCLIHYVPEDSVAVCHL